MYRKKSILIALALIFITAVAVIAQEKLWVVSDGAKLKTESSASSDTIETLPLGAELNVLSSEGSWYKVTTKADNTGWIYRGKVSSTQPEAKEGEGGSLMGAVPGSSIQASSSDTSRSIRGLSPAAQQYATSTGTPAVYQRAVDKVLAMKTSDKDIEQFLKEGRIGEYSK